MNYEERLSWINEHREALGYDLFDTLAESELTEHERLIEKYAPYGMDPWGNWSDQ